MSKTLYYIIFASITAVTVVIVIPKKELKKYFLYGLIFGACGDVLVYSTLHAFGLVKYKNFGGLGIWEDYSLATLLTWLFTFMCFLYFLPTKRWFTVIYIAAWSVLNYSIGVVMRNYGMFEFAGKNGYWLFAVFALWYSFAAYAFRKLEHKAEA